MDKYEEENKKIYESYSQELDEAKQEGQQSLRRKQKERQIRKQRKRQGLLKAFLRFATFLMIIFLIYEFMVIPHWYLKPDVFSKSDTEKIKILNNKIVPDYEIYQSIKDIKILPVPIFFMSVSPIKKRVLKIDAIKNVYIRRYGFPARIDLIVRERVPVVVFKTDLNKKPIAYYTSDEKLITDKNCMNNSQFDDTLVILIKNQDLKKEFNSKKIEYIEKIAKSLETYSQELVEFVDMKDLNDVYVKIESTSVRLGVLDSTVFERIKRIYTILPQINEVNGKIQYIDLSWDKVNYLKLNKKNAPSEPENLKEKTEKKNDI